MSKILAQGMITLTQLYEGAQVILTPSAVLIPCDSKEAPKPDAYANAFTNVRAFLGTMDITSKITLGTLEYSDSTVKASKTGTKVSITAITTRTGYVDIPVSVAIDGETIDLGKHRFSFVKQIDGQTGQTGAQGAPGFSYTLNIKGGTRGVAYAANGTNPEPKTSSQFSVELLKNGVKVANPASISWTCGGNLSGSSSAATFTPTIKSTYNSESSYVKVSVKEFAASLAVEETIPIICTKHADGLDWINEWNNQYVQVGTEKIITPKIFAGTKSSANELTGVAIGRDVLGGNANKVIGIVGYKKNIPVFSLDQDANFFVSSSGSAGDVKNGTNNAKGLYFDGNDLYISGRVRINGGSTIGENNTSIEEVINNSNLGAQANNKIDNLSIGGRNLLLTSNMEHSPKLVNTSSQSRGMRTELYPSNNSFKLTSVNADEENYYRFMQTKHDSLQGLEAGEYYTLSGYVRGKATGSFKYRSESSNGSSWGLNNHVENLDVESETIFKFFKFSTKIPAGAKGHYVSFQLYSPVVGDWIELKDVKFEKGNKATDWTPAPEDINSAINNQVNNAVTGLKVGGNNLLRNGNFAYNMANWSIHDTNSGGTVKSVETASGGDWVPSGKKALKIKGTNTTDRYGVISSTMKLTPNTKYTISGYCAGHRVNKIQVNVRDMDAGMGNIHTININPAYGGNTLDKWYRFETTFTTSQRSNYALNLYAVNFANDGFVWFTDVQLQEGTKATSWTPCSEDVDSNINDVKNSLNSFQNTVNTTFKDGIIEQAEAKAIAQHLKTLDAEKVDIDKEYAAIYSNTYLTGAAKTNLSSAKSSYDSAHASLKSTINTVIADGKVTTSESSSVTSTFNTYNTQLGVYKQRVQEALDNISSEKINGIQIGGRNLIRKADLAQNTSTATYDGATNTWTVNATAGAGGTWGCGLVVKNKNALVPYGKSYVLSFEIKVPRACSWNSDVNNYALTGSSWSGNDNDNTSKRTTSSKSLVANQWIKCWVKWENTNPNNTNKVDIYDNSNFGVVMKDETSNMTYQIRNVKGELGNMPTEWTPAPEDIDNNINDVKNSLSGFQNTVNTTFKDGIIEQAEAKAIARHIQILDTEKADVDKEYSTIYNNSALSGTAKTNLASAKTEFDNAHTSLKSTINTAIADGKVTSSEKTSVDSTFSTYNSKLGAYKQRAQEALDAISSAKVDNIQIGGRNLAKNSIVVEYSSGSLDKSSYISSGTLITTINGTHQGFRFDSQSIYEANQQYVLSFYIQKQSGTINQLGMIHNGKSHKNVKVVCDGISKGDFSQANTSVGTIMNDGNIHKIEVYFTTSSNIPADSGVAYTYIQLNKDTGTPCSAKITKFKLEKGTKPTDWSPAPEDIDNSITDVKNSLNSFQNTVNTSFKDGIIEQAEAKAIAQHLKTLDAEKADIDKEYSTIYSNANLTGSAKTNLASAKTSFDSAHANLKSTINTVISDGRVSSSESASVASTFNTYNTQLGVYKQRVQEALDNISSEKINGIQIGGRNFLLNSTGNLNNTQHWGTFVLDTTKTFEGCNSFKLTRTNSTNASNRHQASQTILSNKLNLTVNDYVTVSGWIYIDSSVALVNANNDISLRNHYSENNSFEDLCIFNYTNSPKNKWVRFSATSKLTKNPMKFQLLVNLAGNGLIWVSKLKVEKGTKATDWTPAPEDIDAEITAVNNKAQDSINKLTELASDSKLTASEKLVVKREWDVIVGEKTKITSEADKFGVSKTDYESKYNTLNSYITPLLSNLTTTSDINGSTFRSNFTNYYNSRQDLLNAITTKVKTLADNAQSTANTANNTANTVNTTVNNNKNNWSNAYNRVVEWAQGAVTGSTNINGGMIATDTITAKQMAIGDFNNYSQLAKGKNLANRYGTANWVEGTNSHSYWQTTNAYFPFTVNETLNPFKAGDKIQIKFDAYTPSTRNVSVGVWFYSDTAASAHIGNVTANVSCSSSWGTKTVNLTLPTGNTYVQNAKSIAILINNGSSGERIEVRNATVNRLVAGDLIVNGTITTDHIHTNGLNANVIKAGTISADRLDANTIVSKVNGGTTEINGNRIQTGTISADKLKIQSRDSFSVNPNFANWTSTYPYGTSAWVDGGISKVTVDNRYVAQFNVSNAGSQQGMYLNGDFFNRGLNLDGMQYIGLEVKYRLTSGTNPAGSCMLLDIYYTDGSYERLNLSLKSINPTVTTNTWYTAKRVFKVSNIQKTFKSVNGYLLANWSSETLTAKTIQFASANAYACTEQDYLTQTWTSGTEINGASIKTGTLSASKITTGTLDATKVSVTNLNADNIKSGTINSDRLNVGTLVSKINNGSTTISGNKITTGTITATQIASDSITADKLTIGMGESGGLSKNPRFTKWSGTYPDGTSAFGDGGISKVSVDGKNVAQFTCSTAGKQYGMNLSSSFFGAGTNLEGIQYFVLECKFRLTSGTNPSGASFLFDIIRTDDTYQRLQLNMTEAGSTLTTNTWYTVRKVFMITDANLAKTFKSVRGYLLGNWTGVGDAVKTIQFASANVYIATKQDYLTQTWTNGTEINGASIKTGTLSADKITTGTLDANKVNVTNIKAGNIVSGTIDASKISVTNLNASNIKSGTIDASKISVTNLNASSITSGTLGGGHNLLKNSKAQNGTNFWLNNGGGISTATHSTYGKCFKTQAPSGIKYHESIKLKNNTEYVYEGYIFSETAISGSSVVPLHYWCMSTANTAGQSQLTVLDYRQSVPVNRWTKCYVHFRTASSGDVYFTPFVYVGGSATFNFWATELSLSESSLESKWSPHPSEIYEGSTIIDATGVTVNNGALRVKNKSGSTVLSGDSNGNLVLAGNITSNATISGGTITGGTLKSTNGDMRFDMNNGYMLLYNNGTKIAQTNKNNISGTNIYGITNGAEYGSYASLGAKTSSNASVYSMMITAAGNDLPNANLKKGITLGYTLHSNNWDFKMGSSSYLCWRQNGSNHDSFITEASDGTLRLFGDNGMYLGYRNGNSNTFVIALRENGSHTYPKSLSVFDDGVRPATDNNGYSLEVNAPLNMKGQSINQCSSIKTLGLEVVEPIAFNRDGEEQTRTLKVTKSTQNIVEFIGSTTIKNGEAIIDLPNDVSFKNYVVLLAPIGLDRKVSIVEKNDDNFKIVGDDGIVDYVIKFESMDYVNYISKSISEDNTDIIIVRSEEDKPKEIFLEN